MRTPLGTSPGQVFEGLRPSILRVRRRYEPFLLPNGLRVLLVEDQGSEQSPGGKLGKIKWKATTGSTSWGSVGKGPWRHPVQRLPL